jgi:cytochrome b
MMQTIRKRRESVPVWDPLIRIFHWSLAGFFLLAYVTEDELLTVHVYAGYAVAGLIIFRLIWGLIGTRHARFIDFVTGPARLVRYLGLLAAGRAPRYLGHNPAGAAMIIALLASLALTAFTGMGLIAGDGIGPLAGTIFANLSGEAFEEAHEFFANLTLFLVVLHVAGVLVSSLLHQENLVKSMVTGRKRLAHEPPSDNGRSIPGDTIGGEAS